MHIYYCHYEYQIDTKKESWKERDYVEFKSDVCPSKDEIKAKILLEWKSKNFKNRTIIEIYNPEKTF